MKHSKKDLVGFTRLPKRVCAPKGLESEVEPCQALLKGQKSLLKVFKQEHDLCDIFLELTLAPSTTVVPILQIFILNNILRTGRLKVQ